MAATGGRAAAKTRATPGTGLGLRQPQPASILGAAVPTPGSGDDRRRFMPQSHKIRGGGRGGEHERGRGPTPPPLPPPKQKGGGGGGGIRENGFHVRGSEKRSDGKE